MKYQREQEVIVMKGHMLGQAGWISNITSNEKPRFCVRFFRVNDSDGRAYTQWYPEDYLMSLDELQQLRAENNELKAALRIIQRETQEMIGYFKDQTFVVQSEVFDSFETVETIVSRVLGGLDIELWKDVE